MFQPDPLLGWSHLARVKAVHPSFEFRARYTIDDFGRRSTGYMGETSEVAILGCSWAFGHGVNDAETFAARLHRERGISIHNYACMGYGPTQAYLQLLHRIDLNQAVAKDGLVAYFWVPDQLMRAWRRLEWITLNSWVNPHGPSHPVFDLVNEELHHSGLVGHEGAVVDHPLLPGVVARTEWRMTIGLVRAMHELVSATGRRFMAIVPPLPDRKSNQATGKKLTALLMESGVPCITMNHEANLRHRDSNSLFYRFDEHPTAAWHAVVSNSLAKALFNDPAENES
ncbi:hypothetical protein [Streptomyces sp. MNP-20]|uniref:hypothetical protein n=1 Tax=Streptomyces sp. MNP-20 TaxID=2721165 RepID=UPI0015559944|nr:hypothetical protein [Streptomyces sp. MNP-20]